jgi:hypothetical protein
LLVAGTTIANTLSKDPAYKTALNIGITDVIQQGKFPRLSGFDYATMPNFPANDLNRVSTFLGHQRGVATLRDVVGNG